MGSGSLSPQLSVLILVITHAAAAAIALAIAAAVRSRAGRESSDGEARNLRSRNSELGMALAVSERALAESQRALVESEARASFEMEGRVRTERQLYHDALHDPLTGLANRSLLLSRLDQAIDRAASGEDGAFGLIYVNFDGFPGDQGEFGHEVEDAFLQEAASRMLQCVREIDTVARIRGDEFAILMDGGADATRVEAAADMVLDELSVPFGFGAGSVVPSASMGVLHGGPFCGSAQDALRDADIAMHFAKSSGKNKRAVFMPDMRRIAFERGRLMNDLRAAIVEGGIGIAFQPIVRMDGAVAGWECLARWHHPEMGPISPDRFIPLAEESGVIGPLGTYVLIEALRTARSLLDEGLVRMEGGPFFAVNISAHQLRQPDFPDLVLSAIERLGIPAAMLHLELTESALIEDRNSVIEVMGRLSQAGIHFKLDDFGTGYSSLNSLHRIPIDSVKIDKSFISRLSPPPDGDPRAAGLVRGILSLGHELGKEVVAEGVETSYQVETLRGFNCDFAQGFYFGRASDREGLRRSLGGPDRPEEGTRTEERSAASEAEAL